MEIIERCNELMTINKDVTFCWIPSHVGIKGNDRADAVAKAALQIPISTEIKLPYIDLKPSIAKHFQSVWQDIWSRATFNKLQPIKPSLGDVKSCSKLSRRDEVVLHRARMGHTYLTHSYLLKREQSPNCNACQCLQTVKRILIECPSYAYIRTKHYNAGLLHELLITLNHKTFLTF